MIKLIRNKRNTNDYEVVVKWSCLPSVSVIRQRVPYAHDWGLEMLLRGKTVGFGKYWYYLIHASEQFGD